MAVTILDLESTSADFLDALEAFGDDVCLWPAIQMAAVREQVRLPTRMLDELQRPPRIANAQRWALLDAIDALVAQAQRHWACMAVHGNDDLALEGNVGLRPVFDIETGGVSATPTPMKTRLGYMAAVNLSLGVASPGRLDPNDPVDIATFRASRVLPVVMAAGNANGLLTGERAFTKWAKADWVVSVSALRDGHLAPDSAIGSPDAPPWPTVSAPDDRLTVFHADTGLVEAHRGTSIAAAVVTGELVRLACFCLTVRSAVMQHSSDEPEGTPRVGAGVVDTGFDRDHISAPTWPYGSLPVMGLHETGVKRLVSAISHTNGTEFVPSSSRLRRLLLASAQPVNGNAPYEVGAGEVSPGSTAVFLARLTVGQYVSLLLGDESPRSPLVDLIGDESPLTDESLVQALEMWAQNAFLWFYDFRHPGPLWSLTFVGPDVVKELG